MSNNFTSWLEDETQLFKIHNNSKDGIYITNPTPEEIEKLIDNLGADLEKKAYDFLILESKATKAVIEGSADICVIQTAVERETPDVFTVETMAYGLADKENTARWHLRTQISDKDAVKKIFIEFTQGIMPDNSEWENAENR